MSDTEKPVSPELDNRNQLVQIKRLPEEAAFVLTFADGYQAQPAYRYLAGYCPCAGCQGHGGRVEWHEPKPGIEPESVKPVGNYAVSIVWKGGCRTGIYSFEYLRKLCSASPPDAAQPGG